MIEKDLNGTSFEDDALGLDLGKYWNRLKKNWKKLIWWAAGGFVLGCLVALSTPHKFMCVAKLAPELSSTATSRLSSMASLVGLSASSMGSTDAIYPMVYPDLVGSPEFVAKLFTMPVTFMDKKDTVNTDLYDYMLNYGKKSVAGAVLGAPMKLVSWAAGLVKGEEDEEPDDAPVDPSCFTKKQGRVYRALQKCIKAEVDKKTMIVTVKTTFDDRYIGADLCRNVVQHLKDFVVDYRTEKAVENLEYCRTVCDQVREEYLTAQTRYARYVDSHQGLSSMNATAEVERLRNESSLKYQLYSSAAQSLQAAEARVQQDKPVFAEIVTPTVPYKSVDSRKKTAMTWCFLAVCIGAVVVMSKKSEEEEV